MKNVEVGDIIQIKSGGPKLIIEFVVGKSPSMNEHINVEEILRTRYFLKDGDVAIKWRDSGREKKDVLINEAILLPNEELQPNINDEITLGNVVSSKLEGIRMTVVWIVGVTASPSGVLDYNEALMNSGRQVGDVVCKWFDGSTLMHQTFPAHELEKVNE
jgi:uncharacterized protein YodC (DUF2158 family)